jgi:hypothetical protein
MLDVQRKGGDTYYSPSTDVLSSRQSSRRENHCAHAPSTTSDVPCSRPHLPLPISAPDCVATQTMLIRARRKRPRCWRSAISQISASVQQCERKRYIRKAQGQEHTRLAVTWSALHQHQRDSKRPGATCSSSKGCSGRGDTRFRKQ